MFNSKLQYAEPLQPQKLPSDLNEPRNQDDEHQKIWRTITAAAAEHHAGTSGGAPPPASRDSAPSALRFRARTRSPWQRAASGPPCAPAAGRGGRATGRERWWRWRRAKRSCRRVGAVGARGRLNDERAREIETSAPRTSASESVCGWPPDG